MRCSALNSHLKDMKIVEDNSCSCGYYQEDTEHYFFQCQQYQQHRAIFNEIDDNMPRHTETFLYGDRNATVDQNAKLFAIVTKFIAKTKRFV